MDNPSSENKKRRFRGSNPKKGQAEAKPRPEAQRAQRRTPGAAAGAERRVVAHEVRVATRRPRQAAKAPVELPVKWAARRLRSGEKCEQVYLYTFIYIYTDIYLYIHIGFSKM